LNRITETEDENTSKYKRYLIRSRGKINNIKKEVEKYSQIAKHKFGV
jgi:hypothetical protein